MSPHPPVDVMASWRHSLEDDLAELARLQGWQSGDLPLDLREWLAQRELDLTTRLARALARWTALGGQLELRSPGGASTGEESDLGPDSSPDEAPPADAPPDEAPPEAGPPLSEAVSDALRAAGGAAPSPPPRALGAAVVRPPPPATAADLAALKATLEARPAFVPAPPPEIDWRTRARTMQQRLQKAMGAEDAYAALAPLVEDLERCETLPDSPLALLVAAYVALLREGQGRSADDARYIALFRTLNRFSKTRRPGYVHGLSVHHSSRGESWRADAREALAELSELLRDDGDDDAPSTPRPRKRPAASRDDDDEEDDGPAIPVDWPWLAHTRGRRAVIFGGDAREPNRRRLQSAFGFAELDWLPAEGLNAQKVRDRVRSGGTEMVLHLLRFVSHKDDEQIKPACRDAGVPFVPVSSGYGVSGVRRAIEQHVQPG